MIASPAQLKALSPVHMLRGAQLAVLGLQRAVQNPSLYTSRNYTQLGILFLVGLVAHFAAALPALALRVGVRLVSYTVTVESSSRTWWEVDLLDFLNFLQHWVLSLPFLLLDLLRNFEPAPFDEVFMLSIAWCDKLYDVKHGGAAEAPTASASTLAFNRAAEPQLQVDSEGKRLRPLYGPSLRAIQPKFQNTFFTRTLKRTAISLAAYAASYIPITGRLVLPGLSFYALNKSVGALPAGVFFLLAATVLPKHATVVLLQTFLGTRSLTRQLLQPYFARLGSSFTPYGRGKWYREREGVLFGFVLPFYLALRLPYVGILVYGLASASAAFLVTKITTPPPVSPSKAGVPPPAEELRAYAADECIWTEGRRNLMKEGWQVVAEDFEQRKSAIRPASSPSSPPSSSSSDASAAVAAARLKAEDRENMPPPAYKPQELKSFSSTASSSAEEPATLGSVANRSRKSSAGSSDTDWIKLTDSSVSGAST